LGQAKGQTDDSKSNENKYPIQYYWLLHKPALNRWCLQTKIYSLNIY
jgi:hypothetical protein